MKKDLSDLAKTVIKYGIAFLCGALITILLLFYFDPAKAENNTQLFKILCDAFSVPGLLLIFAGLIVWLSGEGAFTGFGYLARYLRRSMIPGGRTKYPHETYYDYIQERKEKDKKHSFLFLIIVGGVFLLTGIVFLILYYKSI